MGDNDASDSSPLFSLTINHVFRIPRYGTFVIGKITVGSVRLNEEVIISGGNQRIKSKVTGIEKINKDYEREGKIGLYLAGVSKDDLAPGYTVTVEDYPESVKNLVDEAMLP